MARATVPEVVQNAGLDRRKGLGAEESELEEGEACSYVHHEYDEGIIDPDVALSYIVRIFYVFFYFLLLS